MLLVEEGVGKNIYFRQNSKVVGDSNGRRGDGRVQSGVVIKITGEWPGL